jgi:hypothetical protein
MEGKHIINLDIMRIDVVRLWERGIDYQLVQNR